MKIIVIAGPNGAGKTTFAREYLTKEIPGLRFVNGDDIAAELAVERVARRVREGGHSVPESVIRRRFERGWSNFLERYRQVADEWRVYDNSGEAPVLMAESEDWPGVREPRPSWVPSNDRHPEPTRKTGDREHRYAHTERTLMTEKPGRIPEGEPSNESVLAALTRARDRALARAAAFSSEESHEDPTDETAQPDPQAALKSVQSLEGVG